MKKRAMASVFVGILFLFAAGCATLKTAGHEYVMKGQILEVKDGQAYLCIGSSEGAKAGQEFSVYRFSKIPGEGAKQGTPSFKRDMVGAVKITQVVHEHYAEASIVRGDVRVHDIAELSP